jgi:hypothetical protein
MEELKEAVFNAAVALVNDRCSLSKFEKLEAAVKGLGPKYLTCPIYFPKSKKKKQPTTT